MFLSQIPSLREIIVRTLSSHGARNARALKAEINKHHRKCSLQAIYLELSHLIDAGVVIKVKDLFDLNIVWVCKLFEFSSQLSDLYFRESSNLFSLPAEGQKIVLTFNDPKWTDLFWMQCVSKLMAASNSKHMYQWVPHPWHNLIMNRVSQEFENVLRLVNAKDFIIVGGSTYLDRQAIKAWNKEIYEYSTKEGPFHHDRASYVTLIDDFILIQRYRSVFMEEVDEYFERIRSAGDVKSSDLFRIFGQKTPVRVSLIRDSARARRMRRRFEAHFGL